MQIMLPLGTTENVNENSSIRAVAKGSRARASEYSSNFWDQFEQMPNFASTFKLNAADTLTAPEFRLN